MTKTDTDAVEVTHGPEEPFPRTASVDDLDEAQLDSLRTTLTYTVQRFTSCRVESIYVMGSFARGEAMRVASDLDLRIVVDKRPPEWVRTDVEAYLKNELGPRTEVDLTGFIDARFATKHPTEEPHHEI